jgi:hypothetical protein
MSTNTKAVAIQTPDLATLTEWAADKGKHAEALRTLRSAKTADEFTAALPVAVTLLHDAEAAEQAVAHAKAVAKVGQEVADAHTSYRIGLTAQYLRWFPKVANRDLARALWGADEDSIVRREKMVARDRKALAIIAAAKAGRSTAPEGASISVPSAPAALKMVKHATNVDVKAMVDRAKKGETIVPETPHAVTPVKFGSVVSAAARLSDSLDNVDPSTIDADAVKVLLGTLARIARKVEGMTPKA